MKNRKQLVIPLILMIIIGSSMTSNSNFASTRNIDIVQLIAFGMLLGIFIANLKVKFLNK